MLPPTPSTEADRIALSKMFKAIAEYGRKIRLRRHAEEVTNMEELGSKPEEISQQLPLRQKGRNKKNKQSRVKTE
jgi:hypothetical protein